MAKNNSPHGDRSSSPPEHGVTPLLECRNVRYMGRTTNSVGTFRFNASIHPGQLIQARIKRWHAPRDVISMLMGLNQPASGTVHFAGHSWNEISYEKQFKLRSRIGRVFSGPAWVHSFTVGDNVRLPMVHHRMARRSETRAMIREATEQLAGDRVAAVWHAMKQRPAFVDPYLLQICQWVRAVVVKPLWMVLERPLRYLEPERYPVIVETVDRLRRQGTGILWLAGGSEDQNLVFEKPSIQWSMKDGLLKAQPPSDAPVEPESNE